MKLYVFQAGVLHSNKGAFTAGTNETFVVPVPYFLIEHEKGYVLFDSGHNLATLKNVKTAVSEVIYNAYCPEVFEDGYVLNALKKAGVKPEDIMYHICSHLHFDHTGGIGLFPNATYVLQRHELHYAYAPDPFMKLAYLREDFDKDVNWLLLDGWNTDKYDLFEDGKIIIYYTPGHTSGHQSVLVNMPKEGPIMLAADACYTVENLNELKLSGLACDNTAYTNTLLKFRDMQKRGVKIVTGHDPDAWGSMKKYPDFYS